MKRWIVAAAVLSVSSAWAYIPPSQFIMKTMVQKRAGLKNVRLRSTVTLYEGERPGPIKFKQVSWFVPAENLFRVWITDDQDRKLAVVERGTKNWSPVSALLLETQPADLANVLKGRKIPIKTEDELLQLSTEEARREVELTSLQRWKGQPAWVIARAAKSGPQLWMDKDNFVPLRFIFDRPTDGDSVDVRFEGLRLQKDLPMPRALVAHKLGSETPLFREELSEVSVNMDAGAFKLPPPPAKAAGFTELGQQSSPELQGLIQKYFETLH